MARVLRGFCACDVLQVRLGENPCAALAIKKNPQLLIGKEQSIKPKNHFEIRAESLGKKNTINVFN
jgi:capsule polysaccharide export protein KpsC/LpsZ